jgi:glycosyltransferase involved in cell wall biosynthesis
VVIQAWAHGLPVIAAASQGPSALIRNGKDGVLVPIDDAKALAEATLRLIGDKALRAELSAAGPQRVADEFSQNAVVSKWRALFDEMGVT